MHCPLLALSDESWMKHLSCIISHQMAVLHWFCTSVFVIFLQLLCLGRNLARQVASAGCQLVHTSLGQLLITGLRLRQWHPAELAMLSLHSDPIFPIDILGRLGHRIAQI